MGGRDRSEAANNLSSMLFRHNLEKKCAKFIHGINAPCGLDSLGAVKQ
jgi:hypothetical protein